MYARVFFKFAKCLKYKKVSFSIEAYAVGTAIYKIRINASCRLSLSELSI